MKHGASDVVRTYDPKSVLRNPQYFVKHAIGDVASSFTIAWAIFLRDFFAKYRQTFAGYLSALVPVLVTTLSFVFLEKSNIINFSDNDIHYGSFVFINTIFWELFSECCVGPTREMQNNISSVIRLNFPRESIVIASVLNVLSNFLIKISVAFIFIYFLDVKISPNLFYVFPILLGLLSLGLLIGLIVMPISILYSDFRIALDVVLKLVFFLTPITYQIDYASMGHQWVSKYNFLGYYFTALKEAIFFGHAPDNLMSLALISGVSFASLLLGWVLYRISIPILIERMPS